MSIRVRSLKRKRWTRGLLAAAAVLILLFVYIEDWSRDFTSAFAEIGENAPQSDLRPVVSERSSEELIEGVRWAAARIRNWEYIGDATEGDTTVMVFVCTNRLLRLKDDITVRIDDRGTERVLTAVSQSRLRVGDLGRNPRNLRRLLTELADVLRGSSKDPAPFRRSVS
jgi:hypothetical protein